MTERVHVAFGSCSKDLLPAFVDKMRSIAPDVPLYVVAEFPVEGALWIPHHVKRTFGENFEQCRHAFAGKQIRLAGLVLDPEQPYRGLRLLALRLAGPWRAAFFNPNLDHFMLRPRSAGVIARHIAWRVKTVLRRELWPGGDVYTYLWRLAHPSALVRPLAYWAARAAGVAAAWERGIGKPKTHHASGVAGTRNAEHPRHVSVVIPSRDGRELLAQLMPTLERELAGIGSEVIVVDNGSSDGTGEWLREAYPRVIVVRSSEPLSFARAVNRGIRRAVKSKVLLLNNDMTLEPGFFFALLRAFDEVPDLFCATAQILFPDGRRREETGKAVMTSKPGKEDFPVRCELPLDGEDHSYVLYGSGGCSLFDAEKLRALDGFKEIYEPAYVEDLDVGFRGWQRGWPTVFVAGASVIHRHRATTSRYYTQDQLDQVLERNYLRFLGSTVREADTFARLWRQALDRLNSRAAHMEPDVAALAALRTAWRAAAFRPDAVNTMPEDAILAIGSGDIAVFPGLARRGRTVVLVASPYVPFPLSHGGAVRMYNLMRRAAADYDQVLISYADSLYTPPRELLDICVEIVMVKREGSHARPMTSRPDVVEEFDSPAFHEALRQTARKWKPAIAQLEFTQMAQYARDCGAARTILVEHDVTLDLYRQLLAREEDWETRRQYERWERFEREAWECVDAIAVMSEKDRRAVDDARACVLPNGVDLERFRPFSSEPAAGRLLFIGSFAHLPNLLAADWFLRNVWPRIRAAETSARLHIIAGSRHRYFMERYRDRVQPPLEQEGIEVEDFVSDPRPAYERASIVVAPLLASAGTNIKIMEAMAMGKAIVSTPAGINGLDDLLDGRDLLVARSGAGMAEAVGGLIADTARRKQIERHARETVEKRYGWDAIAARQREIYEPLIHRGGAVESMR